MSSKLPNKIKCIEKLFNDLENYKLVDHKVSVSEREKHIFGRLDSTFKILQAHNKIITDKTRNEFVNANKPWLSNNQLEIIFFHVRIYHMLECMEFIRQLFGIVLIKNKKIKNKKFSDNQTLGQYFKTFSKMFDNTEYEQLINSHLRNSIAHGSFWLKKNVFVFDDKGSQIILKPQQVKDTFEEITKIAEKIVFELRDRHIMLNISES